MTDTSDDLTCPECRAPEGECWSQSGSMGGRPSCFRDKTVGYSRSDWLEYTAKLTDRIQELERERAAWQGFGELKSLAAETGIGASKTAIDAARHHKAEADTLARAVVDLSNQIDGGVSRPYIITDHEMERALTIARRRVGEG